jgi:hypothetical protein
VNFQRASSPPSNALPTPPNGGVRTLPHTPWGVGTRPRLKRGAPTPAPRDKHRKEKPDARHEIRTQPHPARHHRRARRPTPIRQTYQGLRSRRTVTSRPLSPSATTDPSSRCRTNPQQEGSAMTDNSGARQADRLRRLHRAYSREAQERGRSDDVSRRRPYTV